jgi:hypothetical protein
VVHDAGVPRPPSTSTRHSRHEPKDFSESVAHNLGMSIPASFAARITEVPAGTVTSRPSIVTVASAPSGASTGGVPKSGSTRMLMGFLP